MLLVPTDFEPGESADFESDESDKSDESADFESDESDESDESADFESGDFTTDIEIAPIVIKIIAIITKTNAMLTPGKFSMHKNFLINMIKIPTTNPMATPNIEMFILPSIESDGTQPDTNLL